MTCVLPTPWWRRARPPAPVRDAAGGTTATAVLDTGHPAVRALAATAPGAGPREFLQHVHARVARAVAPVYSVQERRPASATLRRGRGSCSQRLAVLEAAARARGVPTRCRGLLVDGEFWAPRFPGLRPLLPATVLLAWPEFHLDGRWVPVSELFGALDHDAPAFVNAGAETLFDALARRAVDTTGCASAGCGHRDGPGLAAHVRRDLGTFDSRDALFAAHGETLCPPVRAALDPVLGRVGAGAAQNRLRRSTTA